jgi:glutathione S-transferase
MLRLYTFAISHYAEKARWALDYKQVAYQERRLMPGLHLLVTKRIAPASCVPILADEGRIVQGSSAIIDHTDARWPERRLTPDLPAERERSIELEQWLDRELGETIRRAFYLHALRDRDLVVPLFTQGAPRWGPLFYRVAFPIVAGRIRAMYGIRPEREAADWAKLDAVFERIDELLIDRRYLVGDRFSRADLTLAALAGPLYSPPEHPIHRPIAEDRYPARIVELRARWLGGRAHEHVTRMYREHRLAANRSFPDTAKSNRGG